MPGFMIVIKGKGKIGYLIGAILFLLIGIGVAIGGFMDWGKSWGITGIVIGLVSIVFLIDAIMNFF